MKRLVVAAVVVVVGVAGVGAIVAARSGTASGSKTPEPAEMAKHTLEPQAAEDAVVELKDTGGRGTAAMQQAAQAGKYLFALFWKEEDSQTAAMRSVLHEAMKELADRANSVEVNVRAASEKAIVDEFGLDRAPMPLILAIAPNGAITGGFPTEARKEDLAEAFATPCTERCMKHLQDGKLVLLCVQNEKTESNDKAMQGVRDFQTDARFASATEIVMLDPADAAETGFLTDLQIRSDTESAVTVFLAPPGSPLAMFEGATTKDQLVETLQKASSGCCPGGSCGPGGCPPQ
jgi:hypothetical protein